ncbi:hypothetical protein KP803_01860 [Vibrio sp. ZSDE26]|uniref:Uncharacterized protein n=1 Tax=Vibrio amylolyticus TaxID=2847292 RepID=A0A9X1XGS5_9VIBR|nr:hypothetical protein [Vibrio amylolyticus]MCK6262016.1 hypothetical protein [Vibrio amylolyticus]
MSDRLKRKRISYSILLDPQNNAADLYASKVLHQWAEKLTELTLASENKDSHALHEARNVHKHVYLSGLFLYLINPELSQRLSAQLTENQISEFTLTTTLQGLGYGSLNQQAEINHETFESQFESLAKTISDQISKESALTREGFDSLAIQRNSDSSEHIQTQTRVDSDIIMATKGQNDHLIELIQDQNREIEQLKSMLVKQGTLIDLLSKDSAGFAEKKLQGANSEKSPVIDLNERLAHVQKVKKKGIF